MKKVVVFLAVVASIFAALIYSAEADEEIIKINVCDYGAVANDGEDDCYAFSNALAAAKDRGKKTEVTIPPGEYYLSKGVNVYSRTTIIATGATITCAENENYTATLYGTHLDEHSTFCNGERCTHGEYGQTHDVVIDGGTWQKEDKIADAEDENGNTVQSAVVYPNALCSFRHAKNITIINATFSNCGAHHMNLSSSKDVVVSNCTFKNSKIIENDFVTAEAIHLDICNGDGESGMSAYPLDGTPVENITVSDCIFENVISGVGNHHVPDGDAPRSKEIKVKNCTFKNIGKYCIEAYGFDGFDTTDCTGENVYSFGICKFSNEVSVQNCAMTGSKDADSMLSISSSGVDLSNLYLDGGRIGVYSAIGADVNVSSCRISKTSAFGLIAVDAKITVADTDILNSVSDAITASENSSVNVSNCNIDTCGRYGILASRAKNLTVVGGSVKNAETSAIHFTSSSGGSVDKTIINGGGSGISSNESESLTLVSPIIENVSQMGIKLIASGNSSVADAEISKSGDIALYCKNSDVVTISKAKIKSNKANGIVFNNCKSAKVKNPSISSSAGNAISAIEGSGVSVSSASISNCKGISAYAKSSTLKLTKTNISDGESFGVYAASNSKVSVTEGEIANCGDYAAASDSAKQFNFTFVNIDGGKGGILAKNCVSFAIESCTLSNLSDIGIAIRNSQNASVSSNTISSSSHALSFKNDVELPQDVSELTEEEKQKKLLQLAEEVKNKCVYSATDNTLSSSKNYDLHIGDNAKVDLKTNTLKNFTVYVSPSSNFSGDLNLPVLSKIALSKTKLTYNGSQRKPKVTVYDTAGRVLSEGTHYSASFSNATNAGTATVKVSGKGIFAGQSLSANYTITPKAITPSVILSSNTFSFDGTAKKPTVTVFDGNTQLKTADYTITWSDGRKEVGTYTITVTLKRNYSGSNTAQFSISKRKITPSILLTTSVYTYNGEEKKPGVLVFDGLKQLSSKYYTVTYPKSAINAGIYTITVKLKGSYSGSNTAQFVINGKKMTPKVTLSKTKFSYDGKVKTPSVTVELSGRKLTKDEYSVKYSSGRKLPGKYSVTVSLKGNFSGSVTKTFEISKIKQSFTLSGKTAKIKKSSSVQSVKRSKLMTITDAKGTLSFKKSSGNSNFSVNAKTGDITVKKNAPKGTYTVKIKVTAAGNGIYDSSTATVSVIIKIS